MTVKYGTFIITALSIWLVVLVTYQCYIYLPSDDCYHEIKAKADELRTPDKIHKYLWTNITYEETWFPVPIRKFWKTRIGDCVEVSNIEYIMLKELGFEVRKNSGTINGEHHQFVMYKLDGEWVYLDNKNIENIGRAKW